MSIRTFLESLKAVPIKGRIIRIVSGNQSCDMDSVVSAIAYSYFYSKKYPSEEPFRPLLNIPQDQLRLRKDILLLLESNSIDPKHLYFLDDVQDLIRLLPKASLNVALVDHCNLQGDVLIQAYEDKRLDVVSIIDHHQDEGVFLDASPRIIAVTGSCSSLVFNYWKSVIDTVIDASVVKLLLGPLLLDTGNMAQKVELGDVLAISEYKKILESAGTSLDSGVFAVNGGKDNFQEVYEDLKRAKKNLDDFLPSDIFLKDFKLFVFQTKGAESVSIGFSSLGKPISWLFKNFKTEEVLEGINDLQKQYLLDIVILGTSFSRGENRVHAREFCYFTKKAAYSSLGDFTSYLELNSDVYKLKEFKDKMKAINKDIIFKVYNMGNTAASRKQTVPEVKRVIETEY